jgi:hypothetical protein
MKDPSSGVLWGPRSDSDRCIEVLLSYSLRILEFRLSRILSDGFERTLTKLLNGIQEVDGSIPFSSTNKIKHLATLSNPTDQRM